MRSESRSTWMVTTSDENIVLLNAIDEESSDRNGTALIELSDREEIRDYELLKVVEEADFAGLTNKEHRQLGEVLAAALGKGKETAGAIAAALDDAF